MMPTLLYPFDNLYLTNATKLIDCIKETKNKKLKYIIIKFKIFISKN